MATPHEGIEEARQIGALDPGQLVTVDLVMRPGQEAAMQRAQEVGEQPLTTALTATQAAARFGYGGREETVLESFAREHRLLVRSKDPLTGLVTISGDAKAIRETFGVEVLRYEGVRGNRRIQFRSYEGEPEIPRPFEGYFDGLLGPSTAPTFSPRNRIGERFSPRDAAGTGMPPYTIADVARAYGVTEADHARNQTIGIIVLGGGYVPQAIAEFCARTGATPPSSLRTVYTGSARNNPVRTGVPGSEDMETYLDIEVAMVYAPGVNIVCYFGDNTPAGFLKAVSRALYDGVTIVSNSWGAPSSVFDNPYLLAWDRTATVGATMKIAILAASGDDGSGDGLPGVNVDAPACVPGVVAIGGTTLPHQDRRREVAWPNTGGGVGDMDAPAHQHELLIANAATGKVGGRVVPDMAISGDPKYGYYLLIPDGAGWQWNAVGGSSAGPPAISGGYANITEELQQHRSGERVGDFNSLAYRLWAPHGGFQDIVAGSNGAYRAQPGFDAVTGHGSPNFDVIRKLTLTQLGVKLAPRTAAMQQPRGLAA